MSDPGLIDRFLEMMAAERGAARNTLLAYRTDLMLASEVLGGRLESAGQTDLARLSAEWATLAASTAARKASALRRFFAFLHEEGLRQDDPSAALPRPA